MVCLLVGCPPSLVPPSFHPTPHTNPTPHLSVLPVLRAGGSGQAVPEMDEVGLALLHVLYGLGGPRTPQLTGP